MANASLNISVIQKWMMNQSKAADYTGLSVKNFKATCPVQPIQVCPGKKLYDRQDLDTWIASMKEETEMETHDAILEKLSLREQGKGLQDIQ